MNGYMLAEFVGAARRGVEERRAEIPLDRLESELARRGEDRPFSEALVVAGLSLIAEFKRRSPGAGDIRPDADVDRVVRAYDRGGAAAISVLTEGPHFGGSLEDLRAARAATDLPILRKDFTVDPYMLYEAAAAGADAVLLVVAALEKDELQHLFDEASALDLDCLVEVHDAEELDIALEVGADVIGINNRNLDDLTIELGTTLELMTQVPAGKTVVSESGIRTEGDIDELDRIGVDAVLIGETLMRAEDPEQRCRELSRTEQGTQA